MLLTIVEDEMDQSIHAEQDDTNQQLMQVAMQTQESLDAEVVASNWVNSNILELSNTSRASFEGCEEEALVLPNLTKGNRSWRSNENTVKNTQEQGDFQK